MDLLVDGGVLSFVAPATWLNKAPRGAWKYLKDWDIVSVMSDASEWFPSVASSFAVPIMFKRPYAGKTQIDGTFCVDLHNDCFPSDNTKLTEENVAFIKEMQSKT